MLGVRFVVGEFFFFFNSLTVMKHGTDNRAPFWYRYSTGGSLPGLLPRLSDAALNISGSINNTGNVRPFFSLIFPRV